MRCLVVASLVSLSLLTLGACSGQGPQRIGASPSWRGDSRGSAGAGRGPVVSAVFARVTAPAARYNDEPLSAPHSELGDAVTSAVRDAALSVGLPVPLPDPRLFRACAELADLVLRNGMVGYPVIEFAVQRQ